MGSTGTGFATSTLEHWYKQDENVRWFSPFGTWSLRLIKVQLFGPSKRCIYQGQDSFLAKSYARRAEEIVYSSDDLDRRYLRSRERGKGSIRSEEAYGEGLALAFGLLISVHVLWCSAGYSLSASSRICIASLGRHQIYFHSNSGYRRARILLTCRRVF